MGFDIQNPSTTITESLFVLKADVADFIHPQQFHAPSTIQSLLTQSIL